MSNLKNTANTNDGIPDGVLNDDEIKYFFKEFNNSALVEIENNLIKLLTDIEKDLRDKKLLKNLSSEEFLIIGQLIIERLKTTNI